MSCERTVRARRRWFAFVHPLLGPTPRANDSAPHRAVRGSGAVPILSLVSNATEKDDRRFFAMSTLTMRTGAEARPSPNFPALSRTINRMEHGRRLSLVQNRGAPEPPAGLEARSDD